MRVRFMHSVPGWSQRRLHVIVSSAFFPLVAMGACGIGALFPSQDLAQDLDRARAYRRRRRMEFLFGVPAPPPEEAQDDPWERIKRRRIENQEAKLKMDETEITPEWVIENVRRKKDAFISMLSKSGFRFRSANSGKDTASKNDDGNTRLRTAKKRWSFGSDSSKRNSRASEGSRNTFNSQESVESSKNNATEKKEPEMKPLLSKSPNTNLQAAEESVTKPQETNQLETKSLNPKSPETRPYNTVATQQAPRVTTTKDIAPVHQPDAGVTISPQPQISPVTRTKKPIEIESQQLHIDTKLKQSFTDQVANPFKETIPEDSRDSPDNPLIDSQAVIESKEVLPEDNAANEETESPKTPATRPKTLKLKKDPKSPKKKKRITFRLSPPRSTKHKSNDEIDATSTKDRDSIDRTRNDSENRDTLDTIQPNNDSGIRLRPLQPQNDEFIRYILRDGGEKDIDPFEHQNEKFLNYIIKDERPVPESRETDDGYTIHPKIHDPDSEFSPDYVRDNPSDEVKDESSGEDAKRPKRKSLLKRIRSSFRRKKKEKE